MSLIYDLKINKNTAWGGDESTQHRPVSGRRIEEWIKESIGTLENSEEQRNNDTYEKILELSEFKENLLNQASEMHDELYDRIPIYSSDLLDRKPKDIDKYLIIPSDSDLDGTVTNNTATTINGTYIDILFKSIKALQSEIAKLKNSFKYGINSYINDNTAMSEAVHDIEDPDEEPLWAVDPEGLSFVDQISIDENHTLTGPVDSSTKGVLKIINMSSWESLSVSEVLDSKIFFYFTTSVPDISILLEDEEENVLNLDLSNIIKSRSLQNILVIISRETSLGGKNFIYITADNINLDLNIITGYYTGTNILATAPYYITLKYKLKQILFRKLDLYKANVYSKYQDFSNQVIPVKPNDSSYKFEAAHITIRSVRTYELLKDLAKYLLDSELVYCKDTRRLYIVDEGRIQPIGGTSKPEDDDTGMTLTELIEKLLQMGIVNTESGQLSLNDVSDITFINNDTEERFKVTIDAYGLFKIDKINTGSTLSTRMLGRIFEDWNIRGLVGVLKGQENNISITKDFGLNGDRIKIGAIYAPLDTDNIFGCTHGYIELENTSDEDFVLDECYLHMCQNHPSKGNVVYHLPLTGIIPAGGTYLIRCKKYAEPEDANTFINVNSFDIEWYVEKELLDLTIYSDREMGFALTYGMEDLSYNTPLYKSDSTDYLPNFGLTVKDKSTFPLVYHKYFIDSIYIGKAYTNEANVGFWGSKNAMPIKSNSIFKNTFELDPAKLAFLATTTKESSRIRWANEKTDYQLLSLNNKYIKFPNTEDFYPIDYFTPKASFEHKNVCTDKSKLDMNKPNMVTCSFGIDIYKTRCFNWISAGKFNEYVFIKNGNSWIKVASYGEEDTSGLRKTFSEEISNIIYNRISGRFPANNTYFTSHKCIINIVENNVESPTTYTYVVGRADKNGNPDLEHCSEEYTFTLYPTNYTPVIYQITDQQGFHWIEYLVWAAAADKINERILQDQSTKNIIPILINTGDMTQNGTRINEWLDYYNAGKCLFNHLELMNVVGNNDLCGTNPWILGTGDDIGKSNSFYFHLFYCYEINPEIVPIVNNKYIPSLYYFDSNTTRYLMVNSEITYENCKSWFNLLAENNDVINIYTGYTIPISSDTSQQYDVSSFTPIYNLIYKITETQKEIIGVCHELPFTVITRDSLKTTLKTIYRSISSANKLVGSHLNQLCPEDNGKGIYWFSRLMEFRGVKLVIGGHKHTYSCTYPLREYYEYGIDLNSYDNGPMTMGATLENDTATFVSNDLLTNYTKFPLTKRRDLGLPASGDSFWPYKSKNDLTGGVIYFMCQATGYKLTSNKELPSPDQKFSIIVPNTGEKNGKDTADDNLKRPMFSIIDNTGIKLVRIENILDDNKGFTLISYGTEPLEFHYLLLNQENNHGTWGTTEDYLILFNNL